MINTNSSSIFPIGFSSNMALLLWCVWGGLLLHILECNYLKVLLKPTYGKPVDSAEDIIERGLTIIKAPGSGSLLETAKRSPYESVRKLAELSYISTVNSSPSIFISFAISIFSLKTLNAYFF